jgi:hypothetical protein
MQQRNNGTLSKVPPATEMPRCTDGPGPLLAIDKVLATHAANEVTYISVGA